MGFNGSRDQRPKDPHFTEQPSICLIELLVITSRIGLSPAVVPKGLGKHPDSMAKG